MKKLVTVAVMLLSIGATGQSFDFNTKKGYVANGYDLTAYFDGTAMQGDDDYELEYGGAKFKFSSSENREKFKSDPKKYLPKYGGYCAYAIAVSGKKVSINPETYEIRDGELFLFYNSGKNNTLELWRNESPEILKAKADKNWQKIKD